MIKIDNNYYIKVYYIYIYIMEENFEDDIIEENSDNEQEQDVENNDDNNEIDDDDDEIENDIENEDELINDILKDSNDLESKYTDYKQNSIIDDNEYNDSEDFLQKFSNEVKKDYIGEYHQECLSINYDEIKILSQINRDSNNIIIDNLHKTLPILTKYEKTRILGIRTKQLNNGATPYINIKENILDNYLIAQMELEQKKIPFIIARPLPNNTFEYWKLQDLEIL